MPNNMTIKRISYKRIRTQLKNHEAIDVLQKLYPRQYEYQTGIKNGYFKNLNLAINDLINLKYIINKLESEHRIQSLTNQIIWISSDWRNEVFQNPKDCKNKLKHQLKFMLGRIAKNPDHKMKNLIQKLMNEIQTNYDPNNNQYIKDLIPQFSRRIDQLIDLKFQNAKTEKITHVKIDPNLKINIEGEDYPI